MPRDIPYVSVSATETYIAATRDYMEKMEYLQDIPKTQDYLVHGFGFLPDEASKMCLHPSYIVAHLSKLCEVRLLFKKLDDKVEKQMKKRLQLEKELEEAEAQALDATNVLEEAKARLMAKRAELETLDDEH